MITQSSYVSGGVLRGLPKMVVTGETDPRRFAHAGGSVDNRNVVMAGGKDTTSTTICKNTVITYNADTQVLQSVAATLSVARSHHAAFGAGNDYVVFAGGLNDVTPYLGSTEIFTISTAAVTAGGDMTTPRNATSGVTISSHRGVVGSGVTATGLTSISERFNFVTKVFNDTSVTITGRRFMREARLMDGDTLSSGGDDNAGNYSKAQHHTNWSTDAVHTATDALFVRSRHVLLGNIDGTLISTTGMTSDSLFATVSEVHYSQLALNQVIEFSVGQIALACGVDGPGFISGGYAPLNAMVAESHIFTPSVTSVEPAEVLLIGGITGTDYSTGATSALKYNGLTDTYKFTGDGGAHSYGAAAKIGSGIVRGGGLSTTNTALNTTEILSSATDTFSSGTAFTLARSGIVGAVGTEGTSPLTTYAYLIGGETTTRVNNVDKMNSSTKAVSSASTLTFPRAHMFAASVPGSGTGSKDILLFGGAQSDNSPAPKVMKFTSPTGTWAEIGANLNPARKQCFGDYVADAYVMYCGGKVTDVAYTSEVDKYDVSGGNITIVGALTAPRALAVGSRLTNNTVVVIGGTTTGGTKLSTTEKVSIVTASGSSLGTVPSVRFAMAQTPSRQNLSPVECRAMAAPYFASIRTTEQFKSGFASFKINQNLSQIIEIPTTAGVSYTITVWMRKNVAYSDSGSDATAPKVKLLGCGMASSNNCSSPAISSSAWNSYTVSGTSQMDGIARLYIVNDSAAVGAAVYVDDITKV